MSIAALAALGGLGLLAGLMIGCVGIGGVIVVPALTYGAGVPIQSAIAAAMMAYILSGLVGTLVYARKGSIRWAMAAWLCAGSMPAAMLGAWASTIAQPLLLEAAIGLLTLVSGIHSLAARSVEDAEDGVVANPSLAGIGAVTGFLSSVTGTGGPLVLIPILMWLRLPVLTSIGLGQVIQTPIAILATLGNIRYGAPDYVLGALLAAGLTLGSWSGAKLAHRLPRATLKRIVSAVLVVVGALIVFKVGQKLWA